MTPTQSGELRWVVPEPLSTAEAILADGARIILRRHGNPEGPRLVVSHANGLAADFYYPFWSLLESRFDLVLYDFRSHGWNPPSDIRTHNLATFVADNERIFEGVDRNFGEKPRIGVFHSLSALAALNHEPPGEGFAALVLFDPPIYPPAGDPLEVDALWKTFGLTTRLSQDRFETREAFCRGMHRSPVFRRLLPGVAELAGRTLLRPASDGGGYELRCPREHQARIFDYSFAYSLERNRREFRCPVRVIGGDPTEEPSFLPSRDLSGLVGLDYDFVPETTHFLQLENPEQCVAMTREFLAAHALDGRA